MFLLVKVTYRLAFKKNQRQTENSLQLSPVTDYRSSARVVTGIFFLNI